MTTTKIHTWSIVSTFIRPAVIAYACYANGYVVSGLICGSLWILSEFITNWMYNYNMRLVIKVLHNLQEGAIIVAENQIRQAQADMLQGRSNGERSH